MERKDLFLKAVAAIDSGDLAELQALLDEHPQLVRDRLDQPEEGYFQHPYLLWFVADNPIRHLRIPDNIVEVTRLLIGYVRQQAADTCDHQLKYTLGLVSTGRIPRECGVQIALIDLLIDSGAKAGKVLGAIGHGNLEAAAHLIGRGGELDLAAAVGLGWRSHMERLEGTASADERHLALVVAAFFGHPDLIRWLLDRGASLNGYVVNGYGFHSHATALHQAVYSGSLDSVKLLVGAGADLKAMDKAYSGTPLGWAGYMQREEGVDDEMKGNYKLIEEYLRSRHR